MFSDTDNSDQKINITGLDKAELLAGLFNSSKAPGMGFFSKGSNIEMTIEMARVHIQNKQATGSLSFDYLDGRYMKVDISGDVLNALQYDKVNGKHAAKTVVEAIRANAKVDFKTDTRALIASQFRELEDEDYARDLYMKGFEKPDF